MLHFMFIKKSKNTGMISWIQNSSIFNLILACFDIICQRRFQWCKFACNATRSGCISLFPCPRKIHKDIPKFLTTLRNLKKESNCQNVYDIMIEKLNRYISSPQKSVIDHHVLVLICELIDRHVVLALNWERVNLSRA